MQQIDIAVVGVGNCFSALLQGLYFYRDDPSGLTGLAHPYIGPYGPGDIRVVAAFDIDRRKVGRDVAEAIFSPPNNTQVFYPEVPLQGVQVQMGPVMDGVSEHMRSVDAARTFDVADAPEPDHDQVVACLRESGAQVLVNYLPVGSEQATRFYAECALRAGIALVNCMPVFIASDPAWATRFEAAGLPLIGDDVKSQLGATIVHRVLTDLLHKRGVRLNRTYQLNTGGNTDFLNMLNRERLASKKLSKTEAVQSVAAKRLAATDIHIGPSDYVPWQKDNKIGFIRMEGKIFGDVSINLEMRLSVEDSPNSAGVVIDMIRCARLAMDRGIGGALPGPSAFFCKHPPQQFTDDEAFQMVSEFIGAQEKKPARNNIYHLSNKGRATEQ